jgi:hypothetical protein
MQPLASWWRRPMHLLLVLVLVLVSPGQWFGSPRRIQTQVTCAS